MQTSESGGFLQPMRTPIAGEGGPDRSCPGKSGFEPGSVSSNAELQQGASERHHEAANDLRGL